jgi:alpha-L-rhamnosidase
VLCIDVVAARWNLPLAIRAQFAHMRRIQHMAFRTLELAFAICVLSACSLAQNYPGTWKGRWIWISGEPYGRTFFLMARRQFDLDAKPSTAKFVITAADRYMLYVNGNYMGRGPARSDAFRKSFDTYEFVQTLHAGKNAIAILTYHYGEANNYSNDERAGLFCQLDITASDGSPKVVGTDENWRVRRARGWAQNVETGYGYREVYDAIADPLNWAQPDFDDSRWDQAYVIPAVETPWSYLEPRQTPMLEEEEVLPKKVVEVGEVLELAERLGDRRVPERLALEPHFPLK